MAKGTGQGTGRSTDSGLKVRVKTSKGCKIGSTLWLQRQLNDPYVAKAKAAGYRSRAAFKLVELDERYKLLHRGQRVVDLGAAPGGWSQVAAKAVGSADEHPLVVGIDYLDMDPIPGVVLLKQDFTEDSAPAALIDAMIACPILINRPLVVSPLGVKLCRPSEAVLDLLPAAQQGPFAKEDGQVVIDAAGERVG